MYRTSPTKCPRGYTNIPNDLIRDRRLSTAAKGLYLIIAALPEKWNYSVAGIAKISHLCRQATLKLVRELEQTGWLSRGQVKDRQGRLVGSHWTLSVCSEVAEIPSTVSQPQLTKQDKTNKSSQPQESSWDDGWEDLG